jgi:hypothetical protein
MSNLALSPDGGGAASGGRHDGSSVTAETAPASVQLPGVGELAYDSRHDRVGEVMALWRTCAVLRPPGGGMEWEVPLGYMHSASPGDDLRARVAELNANSRWGL